ncbi:MAG: Ig-like domain-containing protein [Kastovskya adunca ATA6-11-RM4]|jgi:hypothetical protein|nr:Ig-like domain-containing protein [Kastovskya adunca ATA6-11-RM4]
MKNAKLKLKNVLQPLDQVALALIVVLSVVTGLLLWNGDRSGPRVRNFSWQDQRIGAEDTAFTLTFSRPMDQQSVEENLEITPSLPGKISWAGRKMAYTLTEPAPYGTQYQMQIKGAEDAFKSENGQGTEIQAYEGLFRTRDRAFAYIGVRGQEQGRLILYNLTQQKKLILTPADLVVTDFKHYPNGEQILFAANDKASQSQNLLAEQLYTVTTGLPGKDETSPEPAGKIDRVLDSKDYQNLEFDLSADGQTIVVQRVNRRNPAEFGLWVVQGDEKPRPLGTQGGDFVLTPDSQSLAIAQGQGVAILPLTTTAAKDPLDFLPKFGMVLNFSRDGSAAAMVKFNTDYTRSLFLVTNQGVQQELLRTTGSILDCKFTPYKETLYCLLTQLVEGEEYREDPFVAAIDLKPEANKPQENNSPLVQPLLVLPEQRDIQISLSPDGLGLLFDQIVTAGDSLTTGLRTNEGLAIADALLWLLPLPDMEATDEVPQLQPDQLLPGFRPRWLP